MSKHAVQYRRLAKIGGTTVLGLGATLGLVTPSAAGPQTRSQHEKVTVVASHLNNPRGLGLPRAAGSTWPRPGRAGKVCVKGGEQGTTCIGRTGLSDLVTKHGVKHLVAGLISGSGPGGVAAEGPVRRRGARGARCTGSSG